MPSRVLIVELSDIAAAQYDAALTGDDTDLALAVEKTIVAKLAQVSGNDSVYDREALQTVARVETDYEQVDVRAEDPS